MLCQAIRVRYHGPTDTRGARIRATAKAGSVSLPYPYELSGEAVYRAAADKLCAKFGWTGALAGGRLPDGDYVFIFTGT